MELRDLNRIDIQQLPHSLQMLIECLGIENAYNLTCAFGGRPKYIPSTVNAPRCLRFSPRQPWTP